jgi:hypothetical protein
MMTNSGAPVMPAAARMMCSSCGLCMALADGSLDGPNLRRRKNAGEGRVLTQATALFGIGFEYTAKVFKRPIKDNLPFAIATNECGRIRVQAQPANKIIARDLKQCRLIPKPGGDTPPDLQTDFVMHLVLHGVEASSRSGLIQQQKGLFLRHRGEHLDHNRAVEGENFRHLTPTLSPFEAEREKPWRRSLRRCGVCLMNLSKGADSYGRVTVDAANQFRYGSKTRTR